MDTFCVSASTLSRVSALSHETLPATRIYHNISVMNPQKTALQASTPYCERKTLLYEIRLVQICYL